MHMLRDTGTLIHASRDRSPSSIESIFMTEGLSVDTHLKLTLQLILRVRFNHISCSAII
jgi:hypothetical protein